MQGTTSASPCPSLPDPMTPNRAFQQLISPPPEEELEKELTRARSHSRNTSIQSPPPGSKRKRTTTLKNMPLSEQENTPLPDLTPNPKPKKQTRKTASSSKVPDSPTNRVATQKQRATNPLHLALPSSSASSSAPHRNGRPIKSESPLPCLSLVSTTPPEDSHDSDDELLLIPRSTPLPGQNRSTPLRTTKSVTPIDMTPSTPIRMATPTPRIIEAAMDDVHSDSDDDIDLLPPPPPPRFTEFTTDLKASTAIRPFARSSSPQGGLALKLRRLEDSDDDDLSPVEEHNLDSRSEQGGVIDEEDEEEEVRQMSLPRSPPGSPGPLCVEDLKRKTPDPFNSSSIEALYPPTLHSLPDTQPYAADDTTLDPLSSSDFNRPPSRHGRPSTRASELYYSVWTDNVGDVSYYPSTELEIPKPLVVAAPWDTPNRILDPRNRYRFSNRESPMESRRERVAARKGLPRKSVEEALGNLKEFTERLSFATTSPSNARLPSLFPDTRDLEDEDTPGMESDESDEEEPSDDSSVLDLGTVKITGDKASAEHVMAILRLYNYDLKAAKAAKKHNSRRRHSYGDIEALKKASRRSSVAGSGVKKVSPTSPPNARKRRFTMSASGESRGVFTPVRNFFGGFSLFGGSASPNPKPDDSSNRPSTPPPPPKKWSKVHWKMLDSCFTDERIFLSTTIGTGDVKAVKSENVVKRFLDLEEGAEWVGEEAVLLHRVEALRKKQSEGQGAPPTPMRKHRIASREIETPLSRTIFDKVRREMSLDVPDFTPDRRRVALLGSPSIAAQVLTSRTQDAPQRTSKSYGELLSSARKISTESGGDAPGTCLSSEASDDGQSMSSLLFSYLPTLSTNPTSTPRPDGRPGLPLPPTYKPREVNTPPPPQRVRSIPHKELVDLSHVEVKEKKVPSKQKESGKRWVDLKKIDPPSVVKDREAEAESRRKKMLAGEVRKRAASGASVKSLIGVFEGSETESRPGSRLGDSSGSIDSARTVSVAGEKPAWR